MTSALVHKSDNAQAREQVDIPTPSARRRRWLTIHTRAVDIFVLMGLNAGERSRKDWVPISLLRRADARFKLVSVATLSQSVRSITEVVMSRFARIR
jgi:hypothetical protein